jgi:hypothetical protein
VETKIVASWTLSSRETAYLLDVHLLKTGARGFQVSVKYVCYSAAKKKKAANACNKNV